MMTLFVRSMTLGRGPRALGTERSGLRPRVSSPQMAKLVFLTLRAFCTFVLGRVLILKRAEADEGDEASGYTYMLKKLLGPVPRDGNPICNVNAIQDALSSIMFTKLIPKEGAVIQNLATY